MAILARAASKYWRAARNTQRLRVPSRLRRGPFVVTAAHVYSEYLADRKRAARIASQLGNMPFDLEDRLIDNGAKRRIDIATFRINADEVVALGKKVVLGTDGAWPRAHNPGEIAFFGGFSEVNELL